MQGKKLTYELNNFYFERDCLHYAILFTFDFNGRIQNFSIHIEDPKSELQWKIKILEEVRELILDSKDSALSDFVEYVEKNYKVYFLDLEMYNIIMKNVFYIEKSFENDKNLISYDDLSIGFI